MVFIWILNESTWTVNHKKTCRDSFLFHCALAADTSKKVRVVSKIMAYIVIKHGCVLLTW